MNASPTTSHGYSHALRETVLASFRGAVPPVAVPAGYRAGLLLVALLMVLLPLLYLGLVVAAGWGVFWHATQNVWIFESVRPAKMALLAYGGPLFAGIVLLFFMVKPLFAPRAEQPRVRSLRREDEPLLFAFVERVAAAVGAPAPRRIDVDCQVNASASFRRGLLSMAGNDLVLTVGLPLVAGVSLAQLAGVLAHEFGHFAQGAGMRLTYVIRTINWWFVRVVYGRDRWDEQLAQARQGSGHLFLRGVVALAQLTVWLTRRLLAGLMWIGHAASCFMLRQMELDADRYEARLVGAEVFTATVLELGRLSQAQRAALDDAGALFRDGRLPADLPGLVALNRLQLEPALIAKVDAGVAERRTGRFDTHPADADRIANARRETAPAVFASELPATALFRDFAAVAQAASLDFFRATVGDELAQVQLQGLDELAGRKQAEGAAREALLRYFADLANALRPLPLPESIETPEPAVAAEALRAVHRQLVARVDELASAWRRYDSADTVMLQCAQSRALTGFSFRPNRKALGLGSAEEMERQEPQARQTMADLGATLGEGEALSARRLALALGLAAASGEPWAVEAARETPALLAAAREVGALFPRLLALRDQRAVLAGLAAQIEDYGDNARLGSALTTGFELLRQQYRDLAAELAATPYPFDHARGSLSIAAFAMQFPGPEVPAGAYHGAAGEALANLYDLYFRILGRLATFAESVETAAGLDPLPAAAEAVAADG